MNGAKSDVGEQKAPVTARVRTEVDATPRRWPRVVGVIHLPPLPGSARGGDAASLAGVIERARRDAARYAEAGLDTLIVENFGDAPFAKDAVSAATVSAMTRVVEAVRRESGLEVGVNVLRNDVLSAVAIAAMAGGRFVRANVYVGAMLTDQGLIEGRADAVQALIKQLGARVEVWADVDVKHAAPLAPRPVADQAEDAVLRGLAAAVIVTGRATGQSADPEELRAVRRALPETPVYIGSGASLATLPTMREATGFILGTAAKVDGIVTNEVDVERVRAFVQAASSPPG
jgi:membrane complex biogenesis BtpA family protein